MYRAVSHFKLDRRRSSLCSRRFFVLANHRAALLADLLLDVLFTPVIEGVLTHIIQDALAAASHPGVDARRSRPAPAQRPSSVMRPCSGIIICFCVQSNLFQQGSRHYQVKYAGWDLGASLRPAGDAAQRTESDQREADAETRSAALSTEPEIVESIEMMNLRRWTCVEATNK